MARVKIFLDHNETELDAAHALQKALELHSSGQTHDEQTFDDPAMVDAIQRTVEAHEKMYVELVREISDLLDQEFSRGN